MNVIIETNAGSWTSGPTEFLCLTCNSIQAITPTVKEGHRRTLLELVFDGRTMAAWTIALWGEPTPEEVPEFIAAHASAYAMLLNQDNEYPAFDWIDHTEQEA